MDSELEEEMEESEDDEEDVEASEGGLRDRGEGVLVLDQHQDWLVRNPEAKYEG
jgi:hypothetical protein